MDACAYIDAALPDETGEARWIVTMHRLAASAAEAAENLENSSANEIALWADETMKVSHGGGNRNVGFREGVTEGSHSQGLTRRADRRFILTVRPDFRGGCRMR